jgi:hypothetical protein
MSLEWAPFAVRRPGPAWKVGYSFVGEGGPKRGDVKHSAEGYWSGIYAVLQGNRRASWHFTVGFDRVEQHYPISAYCWHAGDVDDDGGVAANLDLVGIEHLGVAGQPLTPYQIEMTTEITRWCAEQNGYKRFARYPIQDGVWTIAEHNEVSDVPTSCPSGRIPHGLILGDLYNVEDDMADEETRKQWAEAQAIFERAGAYAAQGLPLPPDLLAQLRYLTR